jgi:hypothetical protein
MKRVHSDSRKFLDLTQQIEKAVLDLNARINAAAAASIEQRAAAMNEICRHIDNQQTFIKDTLVQSLTAISDVTCASFASSAKKHAAAMDELRSHVEVQELRLSEMVQLLKTIADGVSALDKVRMAQVERQTDSAKLRKDLLANDAALRFHLLKEWISTNSLAILRRATTAPASARDLISSAPETLEAEAELLEDRILIVGTRGHDERVALALRHLEESCPYTPWFEVRHNGAGITPEMPAVLLRENPGRFALVRKGTAHRA